MELARPLRLSRHVVDLDDGRRVGVAVAGDGVPLVVVHGFGVESLLYAQSLARLAALGFRVIALDVAGHGDTQAVGIFARLDDYRDVLLQALDRLGVQRAVFAGHSMGGRLVVEVGAVAPERVIAAIVVDGIVGGPWEHLRRVLRWTPPALAAYGGAFALDLMRTVPLVGDPRQALKLGSRAGRSMELHVTRPWRALGPGQAILRAGSSVPLLERVHAAGTYVAVVHGDRDVLVPIAAGRDTARRVDGDLVVVHGGGHSWLLRCPETLPAIVAELRQGRLGDAIGDHAGGALRDDALVATLAAAHPPEPMRGRRVAPAYRWSVTRPVRAAQHPAER